MHLAKRVASRVGDLRNSLSRGAALCAFGTQSGDDHGPHDDHGGGASSDEDRFPGLQNAKGPTHWGVADGAAFDRQRHSHHGGHNGDAGAGEDAEAGEAADDAACAAMDNGLPLDAPIVVALHGIGGTAHDP